MSERKPSDSLIQEFTNDALERLSAARRALPAEEPEAARSQVRELAHALKGSAGMFGFGEATALARAIEARHRDGMPFDRALAIAALFALERCIRDREAPPEPLIKLLSENC